ncbi:hypothetical protein BKA70DRAFT_1285988 [Coprinopsis sp. MPI-PUGE-AT-0042]|nr:hypothetical protein BKA70DRAFT_1285988 [Coprinopsis sp. MPI-PUGE-AT-0042]
MVSINGSIAVRNCQPPITSQVHLAPPRDTVNGLAIIEDGGAGDHTCIAHRLHSAVIAWLRRYIPYQHDGSPLRQPSGRRRSLSWYVRRWVVWYVRWVVGPMRRGRVGPSRRRRGWLLGLLGDGLLGPASVLVWVFARVSRRHCEIASAGREEKWLIV